MISKHQICFLFWFRFCRRKHNKLHARCSEGLALYPISQSRACLSFSLFSRCLSPRHVYWLFFYTANRAAEVSRTHLGKESPNKTRLLSNMKARFKLTSPSPRGRSTIELLHEPFNRYSTRRFFATHTALTSSDALDESYLSLKPAQPRPPRFGGEGLRSLVLFRGLVRYIYCSLV